MGVLKFIQSIPEDENINIIDVFSYIIHLISYFEGDNGSLWFWDWKSGHNFQQSQTIVQPGQ